MIDTTKEYGRYCGEHPQTKRELIPDISGELREGLTISGIECKFRRMIAYGWQSFCLKEDRIKIGCEKAEFRCNNKENHEN